MTGDQQKNMAASVRQRLLNISREQREDFQLILIRFALERLISRISQSEYRDQFVLKGAMLFQIWSRESHRPTRDVDFLGQSEHSESRYREIFETLCSIDGEDGLVFDATSIQVATMKEEEKYQGVRTKLNAFLASARIPIQVDIGFGDAITPGPIEIDYPTILDFSAPRIKSYPRETVVAEKFQAMVMLGIANSRMKDFFDIWILSRQFDFNGTSLCQAINATFNRRETVLPSATPLALSKEFSDDSQKRTQWNAFIKKAGLQVGGRSFNSILSELETFLMPPTLAIRSDSEFKLGWPPAGQWR